MAPSRPKGQRTIERDDRGTIRTMKKQDQLQFSNAGRTHDDLP
jgi:hypothetical protein